MRKTTVVAGMLVLALCSLTAQAQMPDPTVAESQMQAYDIGALKAGDYVEYEMSMMGGAMKSSYKLACVGVEGDTVWIETDQLTSMMHKGTLILMAVDKNSRKVTKAFWGKPGEKGKELKVQGGGGATAQPTDTPKVTGTGKVSSEKVKVKDTEFDCEKLEMETSTKIQGTEYKSKSTTWNSEKVAFKAYVDEKSDASKAMGDIKWEGTPSGKGGLVKMESESMGQKTTITLTGWGTDAKQQVQK
jgi:hypothetical protein